jgi:NDP-sugar pyrophosphorylase family protein
MLIFIPMSGLGNRYIRAGYTEPKPLIPVDGKLMIEHVLDMFPSTYPCLFTVNRQHAEETDILEVLERIRPGSKTHVIDVQKEGPVRTVLETEALLPDDEPVLLSYCDMGCVWDFDRFERWLEEGKFDAAWTCYKGFHPSLLGPTQNARCRWDGDVVLEIREKHQFTDDRMSEFTSSGVHWFRRGRDLKRFSRALVENGDRIQNEFFVSMVLQLQVEAGHKVGVFPLERFFQFGTPQDLQDYESWAAGMRALDDFMARAAEATTEAQMVVPMAGLGKRFSDVGYAAPKPLIDVAGRPMIEQTLRMLPKPKERVLVARAEHTSAEAFRSTLDALDPRPRIVELSEVTEGQAITAKIGVERVDPSRPVLIPPCDAGYVYDLEAFAALEADPEVECVVWCARNHLPSIWYPQQSGWIHAEPTSGRAKALAVKKLVDDIPIAEQLALTGTFWFRSGQLFLDAVDELVASGERVNDEWYIDTVAKRMIEQGRNVRAFVVDKFMPWGTPNELNTFLYWNDVHRGGRDF